ncbi:Calx-beta domain-containing protein [Candidatus Neomarinimicrobiota bacterium]
MAQEITFDAASSSGLESVTSTDIPVTCSGYGAFPVTVELSVVIGASSASGSDYSVTEGILTFNSNSTQNVTLSIVSDALYEANEVVVLGLAFASGGGTVTPNDQHAYTINDDDVAPTIYFNAASGSGSEGTSPGNIVVRLSAVSGLNASIDYEDVGTGTASASGVDYSLAPGTVTINAGQTTANIPVTIINDVISEFNETVAVNLLNVTAVNSTLDNPATHTYTIVDNDDDPSVQFTEASSGNSEAVTPATVQLELDAISGKDITVNYSVSGTATGTGTDHNLASGTATINAGELTAELSITITNDALDEYDETIIITLSSPTNASLGTTTTHTYTIVDEDATPAIDFSTGSSSGSEATTPATIEVRLAAAAGRDASVDYAVTGGTATSGGVDFTLASGTATITKGNTTTNISANINNDGLDEANETFIITLSSPTNSSLGTNQTHTYTITDNDDPPTIQFADTLSSGSEGTATANLQVSLSALSGLTATVNYSVTGAGSATGGGVDYTLVAGTATITAGTQSTNISVSIVDDPLDEPSETVVVTLADPINASLGGNTDHTRTIIDNDSPPSVEFTTGTSSGNEGSTSPSFSLALTAVSGFDITVDYAASGLTATEGVDFTMPNGTATIPLGQATTNISAAIIDDAIDEFNETFVVSLSNPTNSSVGTTNPTHTYTITDNDVTPTIGFTGISGSGLEEVTPVQPVIEISAISGKNVSVDYAVSGTALPGGLDYSLATGTASIQPTETDTTLTISIIDDAIYESAETIIITLSNPVNADLDISKDIYTYSIQNNDAAPTIEFDLASSSGGEGTTPVSIQIALSEASAVDASVDYAVTGGTASGSGVDFTLAAGTATIDSAQTSVNITAAIIEDQFDELNETIIITLSNPLNTTLGAQTTHTYTITDNDDPPTVAFVTQGSSGSESTASVDIPVSLSAASQRTITVDYAVTSGDPAATGNGTDYTLADGQLTFTAGTTSMNISATIVDNQVVEEDEAFVVTLSSPVNSNLGALTTHTFTILNDDSPPVDFTVDSVYATGGTEVEGYWNASNTGLTVKVPVDTSSNLVNGSIQLQAKVSNGTYENLGAAHTIVGGDLGQDKVLTRTAAQVEALTNFANDSTLTIRAIMDDAVSNSTTGSPSSSTILIDQAPPAAFTTGSVFTTGGTVVAGYWNASNTGLRIAVPLVNTDASLSGGGIQLRGEADGTFEDLGASVAITQTDVTAQVKTLTVSATEVTTTGVEELADYTEGDILTFRSVITDKAGNSTTGAVSDSALIVDETIPTAAITYSDTLVSQGDTVTFTMTMDEAATATPQISIAYSLNTVPATNMTATADPAVWTYNAIIPAANDGLATVTLTVKDLAGNVLTTGNTTNRARLVVDNTPPGYVLSYTDSLVKSADTFTITATIAEPVQPTPTISLDYAGTGADVTDTAMSQGASDSIWTFLATAPTGNDGFATVTISALDIAGNTVTPISGSTNTLKVDNTVPTLTLTAPVDDDFVRTTVVIYTLGEVLASGQMIWTWESNAGVTDDNSPHNQSLTGNELRAGSFSGLLTNAPTLVQAAEYTVELIGVDRAGNADTVEAATVTYDTLAPGTLDVVIQDGPAADIDSTRSTDTLTVHYSGFNEPTSGIVLYEYALGSSAGASDLVDWTSAGTDTLVTVRGLQLDYKDSYYFMARATDGAGNQSDSVVSDGVRIVDKPRLTIHAVQNIVFSDYLQVLVNDTLGMADSIRVLIDSTRVSVSAIDTYSYVGTHKFTQTGTHSLQVTGYSGWGDTLRTASLSMALAKTWNTWSAASADGRLRVAGTPGAVNEDRQLLVVGSELLGLPSGAEQVYRLADGHMPFVKPVKVSMRQLENSATIEQAQAIYLLGSNGRWEELPSVDEQGTVSAWTNRSGTFRLGPRTIIVPVSTALHQNYPNPFNPVTTIVFDIGLQDGPSQNATVIIYNLLGQQVKTLFDGPALAGRYTLNWQGVDELGSQVATGIYFVRLLTEQGLQKTRKMLLIR